MQWFLKFSVTKVFPFGWLEVTTIIPMSLFLCVSEGRCVSMCL